MASLAASDGNFKRIIFQDISKSFDKEGALKNVSFTVSKGEFVALVGHSGSGKSTLLRTVTNIVIPDSGNVLLNELVVSKLGRKALKELRTQIGYIFQNFGLVPSLSALENVLMGALGTLKYPRLGVWMYPFALQSRAKNLLGKFGISQQSSSKARELSGGQMQRVAIARAMMQEPQIILADEPIASLDPVAAEDVMGFLKDVNADGTTILVSLHQVAIAIKYATRIVGLKNGRVVVDKPTSELTQEDLLGIYRDLDE